MRTWRPNIKPSSSALGRRLVSNLRQLRELRTKPSFTTGYPEGQPLEEESLDLDPPNASSSSISSKLPKSPLLDPKLNAARFGHKVPKAKARGDQLSEFQRKLRKNPYAQALATPTRQCNLTGVHLPQEFLLRFGLAPHPETGEKWHLPNIAADVASDSDRVEAIDTAKSLPATADDAPEDGEASPTVRGPNSRILSGTHFLSSNAALQYVSNLPRSRYIGLLPHRWKEAGIVKSGEPVWREDMADLAADLLRKKARDGLQSLAQWEGRKFIAGCEDWSKLDAHRQPAAVLYLRPYDGKEEDIPPVDYPPPYTIVQYRGKQKIPVYNITALLGRDVLRALKEQDPGSFGEMLAVLKNKRATLDVQRSLWRLMGYLSH